MEVLTAFFTIDGLISTVLFLIMFGIGLSLRFNDFKHVFEHTTALKWGLALQLLLPPLLAACIASIAPISPEIKVGMIVVAACPGGTTSNFLSYLFNGNVALSIALTTINSLITLFSIPLIVNGALYCYMNATTAVTLPFGATLMQIFGLTIVPALLGMLVKKYFPYLAGKSQDFIKVGAALLLGLVFTIKLLAKESDGGAGLTIEMVLLILPFLVLLHVTTLTMAFVCARWVRLSAQNCLTIGIEVGLQNTTLALLITSTLLNSELMAHPALVYGSFTFISTALFAYWYQVKKT